MKNTNQFTTTVESASEYQEATKHAEALGFEPAAFSFHGGWESVDYHNPNHDGEPVFLSEQPETTVVEVGRKNWTVEVAGADGLENIYVQPVQTTTKDKGTVTVTFEEEF